MCMITGAGEVLVLVMDTRSIAVIMVMGVITIPGATDGTALGGVTVDTTVMDMEDITDTDMEDTMDMEDIIVLIIIIPLIDTDTVMVMATGVMPITGVDAATIIEIQ